MSNLLLFTVFTVIVFVSSIANSQLTSHDEQHIGVVWTSFNADQLKKNVSADAESENQHIYNVYRNELFPGMEQLFWAHANGSSFSQAIDDALSAAKEDISRPLVLNIFSHSHGGPGGLYGENLGPNAKLLDFVYGIDYKRVFNLVLNKI